MDNNKNILAGLLILLGGSMLISRYIDLPEGSAGLAVAMILIIGYLVSGNNYINRKSGFLIAGSIMASISIFAIIADLINLGTFEGPLFFIILALGFFVIHFCSSGKTFEKGHYVPSWAHRVGVILMVFAGLVLLSSILEWRGMVILLKNVWPIGLIAVGALIIWQNYNNKGK